MGMKIKKMKVVPNSAGIQSYLKSDKIREDLTNYGEKIATELDGITDADEKWEVSIGERKTRLVLNVTNNDPTVKWKEMSNGKVAKHMASKRFKGKTK